MNRAVGLLVLSFIVLALFAPTTAYSESQLLYVKEWYGVKYYFYNDRVVISYGEENITLYNMLDAIVSKINLVSYQLLISSNNVTYYYSVDVKIFGKTYSFKVLLMFLFSMTGTCKIKVVIDLPFRLPKWLGKALFKWRLIGKYNIHGYRVMRKRLFIDFSDMVRHGKFGRFDKGNGYIDVYSTGFNEKIVIDPVVGVSEGNETKTVYVEYTWFKNYVTNNGFETGDFTNWTVYVSDPNDLGHQIVIDNTTTHSGKYSVYMDIDAGVIGDGMIYQDFSSNDVYVKGIRLWAYVVTVPDSAYVYLENSSGIITEIDITSELSTTNQWIKIEHNFTDPITALRIKIIINAPGAVYFDDIEVLVYHDYNVPINANVYYWVYSDSNATYKYVFNYTFPSDSSSQKAKIPVPKGYEVENITVNNTLIDNYEETPYNDTHKYINITLDCTTCNVSAYFTAWNSVVDLYSDYKYYPYGYNASIHARLLDPYLNPISGENITLWIGAQYKNNQTTLTTQAYIDKGYIIAPHTHKWYFDGEDDYILLNYAPHFNNNDVFSLVVRTKILEDFESGGFYRIFHGYGLTDNWDPDPYQIGVNAGFNYQFIIGNGSSSISVYSGTMSLGGWDVVAGVLTSTALEIYVNGTLKNSKSRTLDPIASPNNPAIGRSYSKYITMYLSYMLMTTNTSYIGTTTIVDNILLFFDPTFFNGTHYLDLVNESIVGTPYGGVERIEDENKWLWIVQDATNDDYVHLKWFPIGSIVRFKDPDTGEIIREVFIGSNDEVVDLPSGNYTVEAIIADGYYEEYTITTDDNGWTNLTITTPNNDAEIIVQAEYNDTYVGVKNTTIYSTGYSWSIAYTPSTAVRKGENITLEFSITRTVDNSKPDGWLYISFNETTYQNEVRDGYTSRLFISNQSGRYNISITSFEDSEGTTISINSKDTLTWCGVRVTYALSPQKYYYNINDTATISYEVFYDTGQHDDWNITIIYNGEELLNTSNYTGSFTIRFETSTNILEFKILERDGNYTVYTYKLYALHLSIEPYMIKTLSGEDILYAKLFLSGYGAVIGEYLLAAYTDKTNKTVLFFTTDSYSMQLYLTEINVSALRLDVAITNLEKQPMDYNISLAVNPYYFRDITYTANIILHVEPFMNNYTYTTIVFDNRGADNILSYTLTVVHGNTTDTFTGDLPFVIGYGLYREIMLYKGFSTEDTATTVLTGITADNVSVLVITPLGLSTGLVNATDTSKLYFSAVLDTNKIYESGETISIKVNVSSIRLPLYIGIKLADMEYKYTAMNTTYNITVPELPAYQLTTYTLRITLLVNNDPVQEKTYSIMVFNTGPKIMLVEPREYSQLNGTVTITLYVYDDSGVESVLWKWDFEEEWHNATLDGYYAYITYDTLKIQNGLARLMVKATDKHGYVSDAVYYFNIYNPVSEVQMNQLWYNIGQWLSRYIFIPGLITGIITTSLGVWLGYAIRKRREKKEKIIVVVNQKGVSKK